jgi:hypothetical protein
LTRPIASQFGHFAGERASRTRPGSVSATPDADIFGQHTSVRRVCPCCWGLSGSWSALQRAGRSARDSRDPASLEEGMGALVTERVRGPGGSLTGQRWARNSFSSRAGCVIAHGRVIAASTFRARHPRRCPRTRHHLRRARWFPGRDARSISRASATLGRKPTFNTVPITATPKLVNRGRAAGRQAGVERVAGRAVDGGVLMAPVAEQTLRNV